MSRYYYAKECGLGSRQLLNNTVSLLQGSIQITELAKRPGSSFDIQLALNWSADNEAVLNAVHNSYDIKETEIGRAHV